MAIKEYIGIDYQELRIERKALGPDSQVSQLEAFIKAAGTTATSAQKEIERVDEYYYAQQTQEDNAEYLRIADELREWIAWAETQINNKRPADKSNNNRTTSQLVKNFPVLKRFDAVSETERSPQVAVLQSFLVFYTLDHYLNDVSNGPPP
ncbi:hypothetical protein HD806DRAFT_534449 [Xylariaceae sp. AK1471]|nr:hypothetical protein HD806DRAFT_534449 [Xylariaceae sp. AK1471]